MRAGSNASMRSRSRRASTGAAPPVPIATTTSPRSTMAGKMKVDRSGRSTTLTGIRCRRACAARSSSRAPPMADTTAMRPEKSACRGSARDISTPPECRSAAKSLSMAPAPSANQRTRAPADRNSRNLLCAAGPLPARPTAPWARSRNTGKKRIAPNSECRRMTFHIGTQLLFQTEEYSTNVSVSPSTGRSRNYGKETDSSCRALAIFWSSRRLSGTSCGSPICLTWAKVR